MDIKIFDTKLLDMDICSATFVVNNEHSGTEQIPFKSPIENIQLGLVGSIVMSPGNAVHSHNGI